MAVNSFTFPDNKLGPYHLLEMIDRGGMAMVYKAVDERSDTIVALKLLYPYLMTEPDSILRFQREAKLITHFAHRHIITLHEFGEIDGNFYLAMRYMSGGNLVRLFAPTMPFELDKSLRILKQVAGALDYAHERNVVHRDLKLENILLDEEGDSALGDFGIARVIDGTRYTQTGQVTGTPHYMSPEQAQGRSDIDYRADLYSFAVLAYRMATGKFPFTADDPLAILNQHIGNIPPTPSSVNPALPRELDYVLWKGLSKSPTDRFASATDFVNAFERAFFAPIMTPRDLYAGEEDSPVKTRESMRTTVMEEQAAEDEPPRKRRAILVMLLALTVLFGTGFFAATRVLLPVLVVMGVVQPTATPTESTGLLVDNQSTTETDAIIFVNTTPTQTSREVPTLMVFVTNTLRPTFTDVPVTTTITRTPTPIVSGTPRPTSTLSAPTTTSAAPTSVPPTSIPPTSVPLNPSLPTSVPPTSILPTSIPPTAVPPTAVPPTSLPPTSVPPTAVPPTAVPPTAVPPTAVPPTAVPPTAVPPLLPIIPTVIQLIPTLLPILPPLLP